MLFWSLTHKVRMKPGKQINNVNVINIGKRDFGNQKQTEYIPYLIHDAPTLSFDSQRNPSCRN